MKVITLLVALLPLTAWAQDYIESYTHNSGFRGSERSLQYTPAENGYISCHNGKNLYTRALYGTNTLWRLETSDMPIFAAYHKSENRNIHFTVTVNGVTTRLDSVTDCTARYRCAERSYLLSDSSWNGGSIQLTALALANREGAVWQIKAHNMPRGSVLTANACATVKVKLNRSGDMGADPANCFAPDPALRDAVQCRVEIGKGDKTKYIIYEDRSVSADNQSEIASEFRKAQRKRDSMAAEITIDTPDPWLNNLADCLAAAADGIWDGQTYQHGAVGWRMPLSGWRGAYTGDFTGRHDRARTHFNAYAASQVTEVEPVIPHPAQDTTMCLARAEKRWGTQMYSNGYICRSPEKNNSMHHYDMDLCYIDELLWHLQWTGDTTYARQVWPVIKSALEWEKRNYDPDGDCLYDAYCCIWASDALYYNSGAVTHSSAYNHRANHLAAKVAELIGEDPSPYQTEADRILNAMDSVLWMPAKGVWAEHRDLMGEQKLHTHPGLWTVYHAIDSETATPGQAYLATRYIDECIPRIPVSAPGLDDDEYAVVSTTDWLPYAWSINNVAFAEIYHTALAYWLAGRADEATRLLKSAVLDGMYLGNSPGNIGQVSFYDAARGESYRDFADPVGVLSRALVQGLFGFTPRALEGRISVMPGFPADWKKASIKHPDFSLSFSAIFPEDWYDSNIYPNDPAIRTDLYELEIGDIPADSIEFIVPCRYTKLFIGDIYNNTSHIPYAITDEGTPYEKVRFTVPKGAPGQKNLFMLAWRGEERDLPDLPCPANHTEEVPSPLGVAYEPSEGTVYLPVNLSEAFNASVTDIFRNRYLSPRSPYTTLQQPVQGIGEWCHPKDTAHIDDAALRAAAGTFTTPDGIPFSTPATGNNIVFTSLYDNYPDSVTIPIAGRADAIALLTAGSTNHMQAYIENATVKVTYADGSEETLTLMPPYNWAPIEQDYFVDNLAFRIPTPRQKRLALKGGQYGSDLGAQLGIDGVYGRRIDGGAANLLFLPLDPAKELTSLKLTAHANEIVIGLMAATLLKTTE